MILQLHFDAEGGVRPPGTQTPSEGPGDLILSLSLSGCLLGIYKVLIR